MGISKRLLLCLRAVSGHIPEELRNDAIRFTFLVPRDGKSKFVVIPTLTGM